MKTGYTSSAGYCLVATAEKNTMRLIAVVTGANSDVERTNSTAALLNYGFRFFETTTIVDSKMSYAEAKVWKGEADTVQLGVKSDFIRTIPKGLVKSFETTVTVYSPVNAPVDTSQIVGKMTITSGKDTIIETPLYPMNSVKKGSLWQRIYDSVLLLFE
jgi:D-alanyl-D-alanine carboxypeptidase (penicillin-binding protein 5/6)